MWMANSHANVNHICYKVYCISKYPCIVLKCKRLVKSKAYYKIKIEPGVKSICLINQHRVILLKNRYHANWISRGQSHYLICIKQGLVKTWIKISGVEITTFYNSTLIQVLTLCIFIWTEVWLIYSYVFEFNSQYVINGINTPHVFQLANHNHVPTGITYKNIE